MDFEAGISFYLPCALFNMSGDEAHPARKMSEWCDSFSMKREALDALPGVG